MIRLRSAAEELKDVIQAATDLLSTAVKAADDHSHSDYMQVTTFVEERMKGANATIAKLETQLKNIENQFQGFTKSTRSRQITTIVFVILTFVTALSILAKALVPIFGG